MDNLIKKLTKKIKRSLNVNEKIRQSDWYHSVFPHLRSFETIKRGSDVICIGSTPARFSIDFSSIDDIIGSNLAVAPETVFYDFQVLKNYHSYLRKGGVVLFVLCPFTLLKDKYTPENGNKYYQNIRYYPVLHRAMIDNYDNKLFEKWVENPYKLGLRVCIRAFKHANKVACNTQRVLSKTEMQTNAEERVKRWMNEFNIDVLNWNNVPDAVKDAQNYNLEIFRQIILFLKERSYKGVIVIPPYSNSLTSLIPYDFIEMSLMRPVSSLGVPVFSYYDKKEWMGNELFKDSFTMNITGSKMLTKAIIEQLKFNGLL